MAKNTKTLGIIPARFASTRFPGKPLVEISGKSMIRRVYEQASKAHLDKVVVATDDERIFRHVKDFGGCVEMTAPTHISGTDRCAEVAARKPYDQYPIVLNIQGDEPLIPPGIINTGLDFLLRNEHFPIATLSRQIDSLDSLLSRHVVKVVFDQQHKAMYFSRSPLPFLQNIPQQQWMEKGRFFKHIGLYLFRRQALLELTALPPARLELAESLEQLRWLENGYPVGIALTELETQGIDTPEDLKKLVISD